MSTGGLSENMKYTIATSDLHISLVENGEHKDWWNRFKVWIWNFILPPHIRFKIKE